MADLKQDKKPIEEKETPKINKPKQSQKDAEVLKLLEEDQDDFQQFQEDAYDQRPPEQVKAKQWRQDWEDQDINDDFAEQLKNELSS